jgi:hypothetical protein
VRFSVRGFQKHDKTFWKKSMPKTFYKKVEEESIFFCHLPLRLFIAFMAVSLHEELKNTIQLLFKQKIKINTNPKILKKRAGR